MSGPQPLQGTKGPFQSNDSRHVAFNARSVMQTLTAISHMEPHSSAPEDIAANNNKRKEALAGVMKDLYICLKNDRSSETEKRQAMTLAGDALRQYGQMLYVDGSFTNNVELTRQILYAGLNAQLFGIGEMNDCHCVLEHFDQLVGDHWHKETPHNLGETRPFEFMSQILLDKNFSEATINKAIENFDESHQFFVLSYTLRWLNGCCRRLDNKEENVQDRMTRFGNLITTAKGLLEIKPDRESNQEKWELEYNDLPGYYEFMMENDPVTENRSIWEARLFSNYEQLEAIALSQNDLEKQARVINKRACGYDDNTQAELQEADFRKVVDIRKKLGEDQNQGLYALALSNLSWRLLTSQTQNYEELEDFISEAEKLVEDRESAGIKDNNHINIDRNFVRSMLYTGMKAFESKDIEKAKVNLAKIEQVFKRRPEGAENFLREETKMLLSLFRTLLSP